MDDYALDAAALARVKQAVVESEQAVKPSDWNPRRPHTAGGVNTPQFFKAGAAPSSDQYYTGDLVTWDGSLETTIAAGVRATALNGAALSPGQRYPARITGTQDANGVPVFTIDDAGGRWGDLHYFRHRTVTSDHQALSYLVGVTSSGIWVQNAQLPSAGGAYGFPLFSGLGGTLSNLHAYISDQSSLGGVGTNARFGVYDIVGGNSIMPNNRLYDSGDLFSGSGNTGFINCTPNITLSQGTLYWVFLRVQNFVSWQGLFGTCFWPVLGFQTPSAFLDGGLIAIAGGGAYGPYPQPWGLVSSNSLLTPDGFAGRNVPVIFFQVSA
jgi:hypothetical protein